MARITLEYPDDVFTYSTSMTVRTSDLARGVHLGYDTLVALMGNARFLFLDHHGIDETASPGIVVADLVATYTAETFLKEELKFELGVVERNKYGGDIVYRVTRPADGALVATAKTGVVFVDQATKRVVSPPPAFTALSDDGE